MSFCYSEFIQNNYNPVDRIGLMKIGQSVQNYVVTAGSLAAYADKQEPDSYMAMNPLCYKNNSINRDKNHVTRLKWLYVDLDYYHSVYKDFTKQQILGLLEMDYFGQSIPVPSYVVDSGRGMYLLWKIDEHMKAYPRWCTMQKYLCSTLNEFGADPKVASDSARVLRRIGSFNTKSNSVVSVLQHNSVKYSLTNLMRDYVKTEPPSKKMIDYAVSIAELLEIDAPDLKNRDAIRKFIQANKDPANLVYQVQKVKKQQEKKKRAKILWLNNSYSMEKARLQDLEKLLLEHRDHDAGCREYILFLYRYWTLCITNEKEISLQKTLDLNRKLKNPLEEKEVISATRSAEKYYDAGKVYKPSNRHIIDVLHITNVEMHDMSFFIDASERKERKKLRNKKAYSLRLKEAGKNTKASAIRKRLAQICKLMKMGRGQYEICKMLHISKSTYYNDKKEIEKLTEEQIRDIMCELAGEQSKPADFHWMQKHGLSQKVAGKRQDFPKFSAHKLYKSFRTVPFVLWGMVPAVSAALADYWQAFLESLSSQRQRLTDFFIDMSADMYYAMCIDKYLE